MLRIHCPYCGTRDHAEFSYEGDATVAWPDITVEDREAWHTAVFLRSNPAGPHFEYWQHSHGCRMWLVVERDTLTHEILSVEAAHPETGQVLAAELGQS